MSIIFIPQEIELHKLATVVSYESQDVVVRTDMDFGTHYRSFGTPTIEKLSVTCDMTQAQMSLFMYFVRLVKAGFFYSTFPDAHNIDIDKSLFYAFNFESTAISRERKGSSKYTVDFTLNWHYQIQGLERS